MRHIFATTLLACVAACSNLTPDQQTKLQRAFSVACDVDGVVVPIAQPIVASLGQGAATAAGVDSLLVHPAVVAACQALNGVPAIVTPVPATPTD
jgi:hypothetical protein